MSTSLPCFSSPGVRAVAARGVPILLSVLEEGFPTNLVSPNTELRGGNGVGSSTVTAPETCESYIPATQIFLGGGREGSYGGGETGCCNRLRRLVARISSCLRLAPTVPAGNWVARKYDPLQLPEIARFVSIMCVSEASDSIRCVLWTAFSE